jgi:hypothetical protein
MSLVIECMVALHADKLDSSTQWIISLGPLSLRLERKKVELLPETELRIFCPTVLAYLL